MATLALRRKSTNSAVRQTVPANRPPSHIHRSDPAVRVMGTMRVARARPRQLSPSTAMSRTFQAAIWLSGRKRIERDEEWSEVNAGSACGRARRQHKRGCTEDASNVSEFNPIYK